MPLTRTTTGTEFISLADAKAHLRITHSDEDALLTAMLTRARERAETDSGMTLTDGAVWTFTADNIPSDADRIRLPRGPVRSVDTFTYTPEPDTTSAVGGQAYSLIGPDSPEIRRVPGQNWPTQADVLLGVTIVYTAGDTAISGDAEQAILLMLGHMYEHREAFAAGVQVYEVPQGYRALIRKLRTRVPDQRDADAKDSIIREPF